MNYIQSSAVFFYVRQVGTPTWKILVCLSGANAPMASQINETDTLHCGVAAGIGNVRLNPSGSAIAITDPNSGQVTYKDMAAWQAAKTLIEFKTESPDQGSAGYGDNFFLWSQGYVTATDLTLAANDVVKFTFTITGIGEPELTPF